MPKAKFVVRIVMSPGDAEKLPMGFLDCLRYAGLIQGLKSHDTYTVFDMLPPKGVSDTFIWAGQSADRMTGFGINAVCSPEFPHD